LHVLMMAPKNIKKCTCMKCGQILNFTRQVIQRHMWTSHSIKHDELEKEVGMKL
jgi:hypothetical protein